MKTNVAIVIPNWNGQDSIVQCLNSLRRQTVESEIIVVDNGSVDSSVETIEKGFTNVTLLKQSKNYGFAGGVNIGIRYALDKGYEYVGLFNNDAVANKNWVKYLTNALLVNPASGIVTCKLLSADKTLMDSTGEEYTHWGLPFPRGRDESKLDIYDEDTDIFGASGGASLYRAEMLKQIGLFDEDFFAYYEDVDISFRAQLAGWKVTYVPDAVAYHQRGATSSKIHGFTTYQTFKNYPLLFIKNVPLRLTPGIFIRLNIAYVSIFISAVMDGRGLYALKGWLRMITLLPKKISERHQIQKSRKVSADYINSIIVHDLPPNAHKLRKLRSMFTRND